MVISIVGLQVLENFYVIFGTVIKILYSKLSKIYLHSSTHGCVVNGRNTMACIHEYFLLLCDFCVLFKSSCFVLFVVYSI